jgi:GNAT superfamily N-acetyltransferase
MTVHISPATLSDIPALCELLDILFSQETDFIPNRAAQQRGLSQIISHPEIGLILVARQDNHPAGMVNLLYTVSTALGDRVALLEDMVVSPNFRGLGVGTQLLEKAILVAHSRGCKRITLLTDSANESAQNFYQKQGFKPSGMIPFRLSLNQ